MKLPFTIENANIFIDAATGGDKVRKIVLEDIVCSKMTSAGLLETLSNLNYDDNGL